MTRSKRKHSKAAGALVARAATATESPVSSGSSDSDLRPRNRACVDETQITLLALPGALGAATYAEAVQHLHGGASNHISASADTTDAIRALSAAVDDLRGLRLLRRRSEEARRRAADAAAGVSMPVRLATNIVRFMHDNTGNWDGPAGGGVVSASFINAKPAVGGIGVEPRGGGVLRVLFTVASGAVADTVVRWRWKLRQTQVAVFDVLSDREEARHRALWPAFLAAKAAGKRAQFHRARLVVDGERVAAPVC
ncbi:hypothetical protein FOA52_002852 [Chlamydomonas sp. UWO 241]|nr:hypothetical protein FOA52_002852 [Chlamydomonas sp. UWO 241]